jgi:energy-coupling factor transporter ATP-binding protein EcfA2
MSHQAVRFSFINWYLIGAKDINIKGSTAYVGPTGAGKSSLQDGVQMLLTGNNHNRLNLNGSASGKSGRSVLDYCLGWTKDASEGGKPMRESCESIISGVFRDGVTNEPVTVGIVLSARLGDQREEVLSRFIAPGFAFSVEDAKRRVGSNETIIPWSELVGIIRQKSPGFEEFKTSAEKFTSEMLRRMRSEGQPPNAKHFVRAFANALAFKPIFDPTQFVRDYILEQDDLDIERVRTSISTWQELEGLIETAEAKLGRINMISDKFRNWGRARVRAEGARLSSAVAELRRVAEDVRTYQDLAGQKEEDLLNERNVLVRRKQYIEEFDEEIRSKTILARTSGDAAFMRQIESEKTHAERELGVAQARLGKIKQAFGNLAQLMPIKAALTPRQARAIDAAKEGYNLINENANPAEMLKGRGETVQALLDEVLAIESLDAILHEKADQIGREVRELQAQIEQTETALSAGAKKGFLSSTATKLMATLERRGIDPVPLCDVVDVIDESWREAVEGLLGRAREAIIVPPERLDEAWDIMLADQDTFSGATLVATNAVGRMRFVNVEKGSILEAVSTDNEFAEAYLKSRIAGFIKAETEADMAKLERAGVMRNGKTKSGLGLSVNSKVRSYMLGKAAQQQSTEALRNELDEVRAAFNNKNATMRLLREAARIIPAAIDILRDGDGPFYLELNLKSGAHRIEELRSSHIKAAGDGGSAVLLDEIAYAEEQRKLYVDEIRDEIDPRIFDLQKDFANASAKLEGALESYKRAYKERQKAWTSISSPEVQKLLELDPEIDEPNAVARLRQVRDDLKRRGKDRSDHRAFLSGVRNEQKTIADNYEAEARREQSQSIRELAQYAAAWNTEVPQIDNESMTTGYVWVMAEKARLDGNELRKYRKECERAANEMRKLLKEDLLSRLAEKLVKVEHKLERLNSRLAVHHFTGQVYSFEWAVNGRFQKMHDLAMKSAASTDEGGLNLDAGDLAEAVQELESLIQGNEGTQKLADYREYFMFEIIMVSQDGSRTSMSTRAVKGSGGEAQAPFYVAMAASLSAAYFPGHMMGEPTGMGLAMFDEAFNKLDVPNTQALLNFYKDMGLQLMIAGPEDKRATFTEVLDTIVVVNKAPDGSGVYIDAEYPGELAKLGLASVNPDHGGVEAFRKVS